VDQKSKNTNIRNSDATVESSTASMSSDPLNAVVQKFRNECGVRAELACWGPGHSLTCRELGSRDKKLQVTFAIDISMSPASRSRLI